MLSHALEIYLVGDLQMIRLPTDHNSLFISQQATLGLGHGKYQPIPKQVEGIKGAVSVACGVDHTMVLLGASIPPLPHSEQKEPSQIGELNPLPSLKDLCEITIAKSIHLQNATSILNFAFYYSCHDLFNFALQFLLR